MRTLLAALCLLVPCNQVFSDFTFEAKPWTKSFLETSCSFSLEKISPHFKTKKSCCTHPTSQGMALVSASLQPEWQVDVVAAAGSLATGKIAARAERLLLSDLKDSPFALSCFLGVAKSQEERVKNPSFFEMAQETCEAGFGLGKHIYVGKNAYTQAFSYLIGGIGRRAQWGQLEAGVYHSFFGNQAVRCSLSHVISFPHHHVFHGYGTIRTHVNEISLQYSYRLDSVEIFLLVAKRWVGKGPLRSAEVYRAGLTYPISL